MGSERQFFEMTESQLAALMGCRSKLLEDNTRNKALEEGKCEADFISTNSVRPLYFTDVFYPQRLRSCVDAPVMLYAIGDTDLNDCRVVSIVGTRHATPYG